MHLWQMHNSAKQDWMVKNKELPLIICTFAITGITSLARQKVSEWLHLGKYGIAWWVSKNYSFNCWSPGIHSHC